jgi:hypothetical protein
MVPFGEEGVPGRREGPSSNICHDTPKTIFLLAQVAGWMEPGKAKNISTS